MKMQEGALPLLELFAKSMAVFEPRAQLTAIWRSLFRDVADRRDCRTDQRFAGRLSCYYQKRSALAHSNTVSSAMALTVAPLNAIGPQRKGLLVSGPLARWQGGCWCQNRVCKLGTRGICEREYRLDNGKT